RLEQRSVITFVQSLLQTICLCSTAAPSNTAAVYVLAFLICSHKAASILETPIGWSRRSAVSTSQEMLLPTPPISTMASTCQPATLDLQELQGGGGCQYSSSPDDSIFFQVGSFDRSLSHMSSVYTET
ncbi:hypothetical protein GOODEAATRI_009884, partial [Goodea atripinnis]